MINTIPAVRYRYGPRPRTKQSYKQCSGTAMICCGSGSDFEKVLVPHRFWFRLRMQTIFSQVFQKRKFSQNLAFSMSKGSLFPRKFASQCLVFCLFITFYIGSGSKSGSRTSCGAGTVMHSSYGSGSARTESYGSCGSGFGSITLSIRCNG
jgi:hypothetical protein